MNKNWILFLGVFLIIGAFFYWADGLAGIGVGVGTGKIIVDQPLKPGIIYTLPPVAALNTGDQPSEYELSVEYHEKQETMEDKGLRPDAGWFSFDPPTFTLEPKQAKPVGVTLNLPVNAKPGKYFAYLEVHPIQRTEAGISALRIAAAAQLWFTVVPANILAGIYYRGLSLYAIYGTWIRLFAGIVVFAVLAVIFRRFFALNVQLKKTKASSPEASLAPKKASGKKSVKKSGAQKT